MFISKGVSSVDPPQRQAQKCLTLLKVHSTAWRNVAVAHYAREEVKISRAIEPQSVR